MIHREMFRAWKLSPTSGLGGFRHQATAAATSNSVRTGVHAYHTTARRTETVHPHDPP